MDRAHLCSDVPSRKRGRPAKNAPTPDPEDSLGNSDLAYDSPQSQATSPSTTPKPGGAQSRGTTRPIAVRPRAPDPIREPEKQEQTQTKSHHKIPHSTVAPIDLVGLENKIETLAQMFEMMAGEIREVKRFNDKVKRQIKKMKSAQKATETRLASAMIWERPQPSMEEQSYILPLGSQEQMMALQPFHESTTKPHLELSPQVAKYLAMDQEGYSALGFSSSSSGSPITSPLSLDVVAFNVGQATVREAKRQMQFLAEYNISSRFAIYDLEQPICTYLTNSIFGETSPTMNYANNTFMRLTGFTWNELVDSEYAQIFAVHEQQYRALAPIMINRPPLSVSDVYHIRTLIRCKSGRLLRVNENVQFFYDQNGHNRFTLISLRDWTDGQLEEGEKHGFDKWVPIVKILLPAQGQMDESDDQQQATTSQSNSEIQANQFPPVSFLSSGASSSLLPSSLATNTLSEFSLRTPDDTFLVPHGDSASFSW